MGIEQPPQRKHGGKGAKVKTSEPMMLEIFKSVVPLLVVLLTAVLSGLVVPRITTHWQDHEKELQLKTSLVDGINESILQIVIAVQFAEHAFAGMPGSFDQAKFDDAYQKWEVQRAVLGGKLKAYFGDRKIPEDFERLVEAISEVYALSGTANPKFRLERINRLKVYFGDQATDWELLADLQKRKTEFIVWFAAWWKLRVELLARKDVFVRELLRAPVEFLHSRP
jgi:hypothetical protein